MTQHVAGNPLAMHFVPSGRSGWSNGMQSVLAATLVAVVSASPSRPAFARDSSRDLSLTHSSQSWCSPPHLFCFVFRRGGEEENG